VALIPSPSDRRFRAGQGVHPVKLSDLNGSHRAEAKESWRRLKKAVKGDSKAERWLRDHKYLWF